MTTSTPAESPARFIAAPASLDSGAPHFRMSFRIDRRPVRATLRYTALGLVEPWINGQRATDELLAPGWTSYKHRVVVSEVDATNLIVQGDNVLGAVAGRGWAAGRLGWDGGSGIYVDRPAVWLHLELEFDDGDVQTVTTGPDFRVATGGTLADDLYDGETHDARLEIDGWASPGLDDSDWVHADTVDWDDSTLELRSAEPIRATGRLAPVKVTRTASGAHVVDFGQNIAGWVRLRVIGDAGTEITIRHGELLTPDGELEDRKSVV